jgi:hypothetical protein
MRSISTRRFREPVEIRPQFGADVVSPAPALRERPRVRVNALDDRVGESVEERPILGWHPEQMADHADGQRVGEFVDDVNDVLAAEAVDPPRRRLEERRPQAFDSPRCVRQSEASGRAGSVPSNRAAGAECVLSFPMRTISVRLAVR